MAIGSNSAVAAGLAVARTLGLHSDEPVVLREAWHVLLHLRPLPIVARISTALPFPEGPKPDGVSRELAVATHAARAGAPVVPPTDEVDPGPHRHAGHLVTFWRYVEPKGPPEPREAGRALREVHEALEDYEGPLPSAGHPEETSEMIAALEPTEATAVVLAVLSEPLDIDGQAINGDAHLYNCLGSARGPLWHDFETSCRAPREYDLAALVSRQRVFGEDGPALEALAAYGPYDAERLEMMLPVYVAWIAASFLMALPRRPELADAADARICWLSQRQDDAD